LKTSWPVTRRIATATKPLKTDSLIFSNRAYRVVIFRNTGIFLPGLLPFGTRITGKNPGAGMSNKMAVLINGEVILEYDRSVALTEQQRLSLEKMDSKMDTGINLAGEQLTSPDKNQRMQFVALNLVNALYNDENEAIIAASTAYLAENLPDLKQVKADNRQGQWLVDLVFDKEYQNQVKVSFSGLQ
jgi:hypothetical protein